MNEKTTAGKRREIRFRETTAADRPRLIGPVNATFSVETFIDGTRTDEEHLGAVMSKKLSTHGSTQRQLTYSYLRFLAYLRVSFS